MKPLIICALPRSRTFWLHKYFACYENIDSHHELTAKVDSVQQFFDSLHPPGKQFINVDAFSIMTFPWGIKEKANLVFIKKDISRCVESTLEVFEKPTWVHQKGFDYLYTWYEDMYEQYMDNADVVIEYKDLDHNLELLHEFTVEKYNKEIHKTMIDKVLNVEKQYISFEKFFIWQQ